MLGMSRISLGPSLLLIALLTACGGGSMSNNNNNNPPPPPPINASVAVSNPPSGPFDEFLSTSFQPAEWDDTFFCSNIATCTSQTWSSAKTTLLGTLQSKHIRMQTVSQGIPQTSATTWDFSVLDAIAQPVLTVGDHSPELELGFAPSFMWSTGNLDASQFASYSADMVSYYNNANGFNAPDGKHVSPSGLPITWWGILNEPSINNVTDTQYVQLYNTVVPAMQAADPNVKFVALELCCNSESYASTFAANVTAQVDAVGTHYYSSCNQKDTDAQVMGTIPSFVSSVQTIYANLSVNPNLSNTPVWVTENNVNADFDKGGGISACNGTTFVPDQRGSSAFFAAWRPYVFSQLGKAGAKALYHWDFDADVQFGEVDFNTAQTQLSYWVDYWLARMFPGGSGQQLLQSTNSDTSDIEALPVVNTDGSVVIMISNHAVASPADNNGEGLTADVAIDTSALGPFTSASEIVIDSTTSVANGPNTQSISPASPLKLSLNGYSVAMIKLTP